MSIDRRNLRAQSRRRGLLRWWLVLLVQTLGAVALGLFLVWLVRVAS